MKRSIKVVATASATIISLSAIIVPPAQAQDPTGLTGHCGTLPVLAGAIGDVVAGVGRGVTKSLRVAYGSDPLDPNDPGVQEIPVYAHAPEMIAGYLMTIPQMDTATRQQHFGQYC